jgi:two-component system nitrate/nitrite sensor histidine kinase NarX
VDIELEVGGIPEEPPEAVTIHLLGIVNEALSNVARHSGATRAWVDVVRDDRGLTVAVRDNGRGFDPAAGAALGHQGLRNMRSRAAGIGAIMDISSAQEQGTEIQVVIDLDGTGTGEAG